MLLYQGAIAFELWTGKKAPVEVMRKALKEALKK
jgi:shikimate dehydrogenase